MCINHNIYSNFNSRVPIRDFYQAEMIVLCHPFDINKKFNIQYFPWKRFDIQYDAA